MSTAPGAETTRRELKRLLEENVMRRKFLRLPKDWPQRLRTVLDRVGAIAERYRLESAWRLSDVNQLGKRLARLEARVVGLERHLDRELLNPSQIGPLTALVNFDWDDQLWPFFAWVQRTHEVREQIAAARARLPRLRRGGRLKADRPELDARERLAATLVAIFQGHDLRPTTNPNGLCAEVLKAAIEAAGGEPPENVEDTLAKVLRRDRTSAT